MAVTEKGISKSKASRSRKVDVPSVQRALLAWYDLERRDLPWRADTDAYRVWVSEIMLQQTRVDVVCPYYTRWMQSFPTLDDLARADVDDVLKQWEGLGYYSRARNLHGAARMVRERMAGVIPSTHAELKTLPGVGDYTAGAIASIAFNQSVPAVDGNVRRVLSRLFDIDAPTAASVRAEADQLVDPDRPGDGNQALMELGATICTPRSPRCADCPIASHCLAHARGTVERRPGIKPKKPIPHIRVNSLVVLYREAVLLTRRPRTGLLAGLWCFPEVEQAPARATPLGEVTHAFSHKRITYDIHLLKGRAPAATAGEWVRLSDLSTHTLPAAQRKIEALMRRSLAPNRP
jgi:A/G-specific adenine glycosylase